MNHRKIHLISPAGSCRPFIEALNLPSASALVTLIQELIGSDYAVGGNVEIFEAQEDELSGGRKDDRVRAADIEQALGDDDVVAMILIRGGAWFARVLPLIDYSVLDTRKKPIALFGFSELTTLVNLVGAHESALGVYDMGPAFLSYGLQRYARQHATDKGPDETPAEWAHARLLTELQAYFRDVVSMIEGRGTCRRITAELVQGALPEQSEVTFVGGNLTVLSTIIGSRFEMWLGDDAPWLIIEDFNDKLERIDRFLAHLTLAGIWERCSGVLLGDFHRGYQELTPAVVSLLEYHLPADRTFPILTTPHVGHIWPMAPLPLHLPLTIERVAGGAYSIHWPSALLKTVYSL